MAIHVSLPERIFLTIDNPDTCLVAGYISAAMLTVIMVSSVCFILGTVPECQVDPKPDQCSVFKEVEDVCLAIFVIEYSLRLLTCWAVRQEIFKKADFHDLVVGFEPIDLPSCLTRLRRFIFAPSNLIDLAAILPGVIALFVNSEGGAFVILRLVRLTRVFRALKSPAFQAPVQVIARTVQQSTKALYVLMFNLCLGIVIFGSLMYMAEGGEELNAFGFGGKWNPEVKKFERIVGRQWNAVDGQWENLWDISPFQSIPHAFWWAIVTVMTVGYGDNYPTTSLGYVVAVSTMVFSLVILALPIGIVGNNFKNEWDMYELKREVEAENVKAEMRFITSAIKTLDPGRMSRLMLIEVWHDNPNLPEDLPPREPASSFMGEAKVKLDLDLTRPTTITTTIKLEENMELVRRGVEGKITVRIEWRPDLKAVSDEDSEAEILEGSFSTSPSNTSPSRIKQAPPPRLALSLGSSVESIVNGPVATADLCGQLKVTLVEGCGLVNLNNSRPQDGSSPYCIVLCYPTFEENDRTPVPYAWKSPIVRNTLSPKWNATHVFDFRWSRQHVSSRPSMVFQSTDDDEDGVRARKRALSNASSQETPNPGKLLIQDGTRSAEAGANLTAMDEAMGILHDFTKELRLQRESIKLVRDDVKTLSGRVDRLSEAKGPLLPGSIPDAE
jgi:hypothetical protein